MDVRPLDQAQKKFADRAAGARGDYENGVRNAGAKWLAGVTAAEGAWADGTRAAIDNGRFGAGVRKAGPTKYQDRASKLGPDRFATGVREGAAAWGEGFRPFADDLRSFDAGPKGMRGSTQNADRARKVAERMRAKRIELLGSR
ncbi:MAG: hypothetical protein LC750_16740 [Actinobacteria bacterium]|nr:hypothetical protein [Actinomycetota bacterium]